MEKSGLGNCRHCDYHPISNTAPKCPRCGGLYPHKGHLRVRLLAPLVKVFKKGISRWEDVARFILFMVYLGICLLLILKMRK